MAYSGIVWSDQEALQEIHEEIKSEFPTVDHIQGIHLAKQMQTENTVVLFDVREQPEYDISHLPGAIRVDPQISAQDFESHYGESLRDKTVVFYCSVGKRSSLLADKVRKEVIERGATQVLNLEMGIFGWHNNARILSNEFTQTDFVHPYNWRWGRLIERKSLIRYE